MRLNLEDSAQGSDAKPNPLVLPSINQVLQALGPGSGTARVADQGAGRLRHLRLMAASFRSLYIVDTPVQVNRRQRLLGVHRRNYHDLAEEWSTQARKVTVTTSDEFLSSSLGLDFVLSACVYNGMPLVVRSELAAAASANLRVGGWYIVIASRNDRSVMRRCTDSNRHEDGYVFTRNGSTTFYVNFSDERQVADEIQRHGFSLESNRSRYDYVWLTFRRE